ncbi:hypothetical protein [Microbacterium sp. NPDC057944]|uniref:hypothetical protein n=1 Tax=Microbacterium sp. NPDC057944 TaxID=3346286 RepID=UPI0036DA1B6D
MLSAAPRYAWRRSDLVLGRMLALSPLSIVISFVFSVLALGIVSVFTPKPANPQSGWDEMTGIFEGMMAGFAVAQIVLAAAQIAIAIAVAIIASRLRRFRRGHVLGPIVIALSLAAVVSTALDCAGRITPELVVASGTGTLHDVLRWASPVLVALAIALLLMLLRMCGLATGRFPSLPPLALASPLLLIPSVRMLDLVAAFIPPVILGAVWLRALGNAKAGGASVDAPPASVLS